MTTTTHTRTYNSIMFADPYKVCRQYDQQVEGVLCVDEGVWPNLPCHHYAGYDDTCPSWSPVDGCSCVEFLGYKPYAEPQA